MKKVGLFLLRLLVLIVRVYVVLIGLVLFISSFAWIVSEKDGWVMMPLVLGLIFIFPFRLLKRNFDLCFYFVLLTINTLINTGTQSTDWTSWPFYINLVIVAWYILNRIGRTSVDPFFRLKRK